MEQNNHNFSIVNSASEIKNETDLNILLPKFWDLTELVDVKYLSNEETCCEEHYSKTYNRDSTGRFIVSLPFN